MRTGHYARLKGRVAAALLVMGGINGPAFADRHGIDALFLLRTKQGLSERLTGRIDRFL